MPEFEHDTMDMEVYAFFNEVVSTAFDELEKDHLSTPIKAKLRVMAEMGQAEIYIRHDLASDKKSYRYTLFLDENSLISLCSFITRKGKRTEYRNQINDNYQDASEADIVDNFLLQYRGWPTGPIGEPPAD